MRGCAYVRKGAWSYLPWISTPTPLLYINSIIWGTRGWPKSIKGASSFVRSWIKRAIFRLAKPEKAQPTQHARAESACILCRAARRKSHALWINLLSVNAIAYEQCLRQRENSCKRMQRQIYLHYAECSWIWIKSTFSSPKECRRLWGRV